VDGQLLDNGEVREAGVRCTHVGSRWDGFGSDTHGYEFGCLFITFISNSETNANITEYEYKMDISNSDSHSNTYSIYNIVIMSFNFICR
jgi:hypothetical protein